MLFSHSTARYISSQIQDLSLLGQLVDLDGQRLGRDDLVLKVLVIAMDGVVAAIVLALELVRYDLHVAGTGGAP